QMRPVRENHLWANFVYNPLDFGMDAWPTNGVAFYDGYPNVRLLNSNLKHSYLGPATNTPPLLLATDANSLLLARQGDWPDNFSPFDVADVVIQGDSEHGYYLPTIVRNAYGLPIGGLLHPLANHQTQGLLSGGSPIDGLGGPAYIATPIPAFHF